MLSEQSLREGKLEDALSQLQEQVRDDPSSARLRVFLFQLLAVMGEWGRALNQLEVAGDLDPGTLAMVQAYREALHCEGLRAEIFSGRRSPLVFGEPEAWIALLMEALRLTAEGQYRKAGDLRAQAFEAAPTTSGTIDDQAFEWIADADTRLGPVLEAVVNGRYYWIPFHRIREIHVEKPEDLRDLVWMPAHFKWANSGETVGMIPTRYPGSETREDNLLRLAQKTEWDRQEGDAYLGAGQRMLATDAGDHPLMDVRLVLLNTEDTAEEPPSEAGTDG